MGKNKQIKPIKSKKNLIKACYHATCGLKTAFQIDAAFRIEVFFTAIVIPLALFLGTTSIERIILVSSWLLVLLMEIINSSIEALVDRISLDIHPLSKKIKDISAAAVLLAIINASIIWLIVLADRVLV